MTEAVLAEIISDYNSNYIVKQLLCEDDNAAMTSNVACVQKKNYQIWKYITRLFGLPKDVAEIIADMMVEKKSSEKIKMDSGEVCLLSVLRTQAVFHGTKEWQETTFGNDENETPSYRMSYSNYWGKRQFCIDAECGIQNLEKFGIDPVIKHIPMLVRAKFLNTNIPDDLIDLVWCKYLLEVTATLVEKIGEYLFRDIAIAHPVLKNFNERRVVSFQEFDSFQMTTRQTKKMLILSVMGVERFIAPTYFAQFQDEAHIRRCCFEELCAKVAFDLMYYYDTPSTDPADIVLTGMRDSPFYGSADVRWYKGYQNKFWKRDSCPNIEYAEREAEVSRHLAFVTGTHTASHSRKANVPQSAYSNRTGDCRSFTVHKMYEPMYTAYGYTITRGLHANLYELYLTFVQLHLPMSNIVSSESVLGLLRDEALSGCVDLHAPHDSQSGYLDKFYSPVLMDSRLFMSRIRSNIMLMQNLIEHKKDLLATTHCAYAVEEIRFDIPLRAQRLRIRASETYKKAAEHVRTELKTPRNKLCFTRHHASHYIPGDDQDDDAFEIIGTSNHYHAARLQVEMDRRFSNNHGDQRESIASTSGEAKQPGPTLFEDSDDILAEYEKWEDVEMEARMAKMQANKIARRQRAKPKEECKPVVIDKTSLAEYYKEPVTYAQALKGKDPVKKVEAVLDPFSEEDLKFIEMERRDAEYMQSEIDLLTTVTGEQYETPLVSSSKMCDNELKKRRRIKVNPRPYSRTITNEPIKETEDLVPVPHDGPFSVNAIVKPIDEQSHVSQTTTRENEAKGRKEKPSRKQYVLKPTQQVMGEVANLSKAQKVRTVNSPKLARERKTCDNKSKLIAKAGMESTISPIAGTALTTHKSSKKPIFDKAVLVHSDNLRNFKGRELTIFTNARNFMKLNAREKFVDAKMAKMFPIVEKRCATLGIKVLKTFSELPKKQNVPRVVVDNKLVKKSTEGRCKGNNWAPLEKVTMEDRKQQNQILEEVVEKMYDGKTPHGKWVKKNLNDMKKSVEKHVEKRHGNLCPIDDIIDDCSHHHEKRKVDGKPAGPTFMDYDKWEEILKEVTEGKLLMMAEEDEEWNNLSIYIPYGRDGLFVWDVDNTNQHQLGFEVTKPIIMPDMPLAMDDVRLPNFYAHDYSTGKFDPLGDDKYVAADAEDDVFIVDDTAFEKGRTFIKVLNTSLRKRATFKNRLPTLLLPHLMPRALNSVTEPLDGEESYWDEAVINDNMEVVHFTNDRHFENCEIEVPIESESEAVRDRSVRGLQSGRCNPMLITEPWPKSEDLQTKKTIHELAKRIRHKVKELSFVDGHGLNIEDDLFYNDESPIIMLKLQDYADKKIGRPILYNFKGNVNGKSLFLFPGLGYYLPQMVKHEMTANSAYDDLVGSVPIVAVNVQRVEFYGDQIIQSITTKANGKYLIPLINGKKNEEQKRTLATKLRDYFRNVFLELKCMPGIINNYWKGWALQRYRAIKIIDSRDVQTTRMSGEFRVRLPNIDGRTKVDETAQERINHIILCQLPSVSAEVDMLTILKNAMLAVHRVYGLTIAESELAAITSLHRAANVSGVLSRAIDSVREVLAYSN